VAGRQDRLDRLEKAVREYAASERKRAADELAFLKAVLDGRTGGRALQEVSEGRTAADARAAISEFLSGGRP
jgi:hypothetical protein